MSSSTQSSTSVFEEAWRTFTDDLNDTEKALFKKTTSPQDLLDEVTYDHDSYADKSVSLRATTKMKGTVDGLLRFGKAFDVLSNIYPEVLGSLWGGLRIVLHLAKSFVEFFENIVECIHFIGVSLARLKVVENIFQSSDSLRIALEDLYMSLLHFCYDAKRVLQDINVKKKRGLIPKRLKTFIHGLWSSFNAQFEQTKDDLKELIDRVDREAVVAGLQAASLHQDEQAQRWIEQTAENEDAKAHRKDTLIHHESEKQEREEQSKWRQAEAVLWQEQKDLNAALTGFVTDTNLLHTCEWLAPVDPEHNHENACKAHHPGTCSWVLSTPEFRGWTDEQNAILWVHAIPGAGKTVLSASVIQCIKTTLGSNDGLAYYYFDYKHQDQQTIRALFASLVASLILNYPSYYAIVEPKLHRARSAGRTPATSLLRTLLLDAISHFTTLYLVIDALDECENREELFTQFFDIPSTSSDNVRIFATSRNNPDIREGFEEIPHTPLEMSESVVQKDIRVFVRAEVAEIIKKQKIKIRNPNLTNEIIDTLSEKSDGMFQWVRCQLDQLRKLKTDKAIRNSLSKLPKGLDETYSRMLEALQAQHDEDEYMCIQRLLRWLTHAVRPLKIQELAEAIAIESDQDFFDEDALLTDPMDILRYGEGLVVIKRDRVHLSHFSVREYLVSTAVQNKSPMFYMGTLEANADLAATCLTYLTLSDFSTDRLKDAPNQPPCSFLQYASCEWPTHYRRVAEYDQRPKTLVSTLLSMSPVSTNFVLMCNIVSKHKIDLDGFSPLQYCAAIGLEEQLRHLLESGLDVNSLAGRYGTPLNCAVKNDHIDIVKYLVDGMGADPKLRSVALSNGRGGNALHWALDEDHVSTVSEEMVFVILDSVHGSDLNEIGGNLQPQRPIHYAARGKRLDIVKLLIQFGAELDAPDAHGKTPLAIAVEEDNLEMAGYLLEQGAIFKDADECDSIRESPFRIDALVPNMSGPLWDVMTTLRSQAEGSVTSAYWGFALSSAAGEGKLDPLTQLLDSNIDATGVHPANSTETPNPEGANTSSKNMEAQIGPIFSAIAPALQNNSADIVLTLLNRLLEIIHTLQKDALPKMGGDIHQVLIYDMADSRFCKSPWYSCSLFLAMLAGYLKTAQSAARGVASTENVRHKTDPLRMIQVGWPQEGEKNTTSVDAAQEGNPAGFGLVRTATELDSSMLTSSSHAIIKELSERARILWHGKRNTRKAFELYFVGLKPETVRTQLVEFLLSKGADANFLDRASRTPLYWASEFAKVDPGFNTVCTELKQAGGLLHVPDEDAVSNLRDSILIELREKTIAGESLSVSAIDLTRKSDWNLLGRLLYFAKDFERATVAFEISTVYNETLTIDPPVFHYFFCDECNPGDYRDETLINGYRYVIRDSLDSDLCNACRGNIEVEALRIPNNTWITEQQEIQSRMEHAFADLQTIHSNDAAAFELAKKKYRKELAIAKRDQMLEWLKSVTDEYEKCDISSLVSTYRRTGPEDMTHERSSALP